MVWQIFKLPIHHATATLVSHNERTLAIVHKSIDTGHFFHTSLAQCLVFLGIL